MNSKPTNKLLNNKENHNSSDELFSNIPYKIENQGKNNFQYFPLVTKDSLEGNHTIYLAIQNNGSINNFIMNENENKYIYKPNKSTQNVTNQNEILIIQKSIQLQIIKKKFEYLLTTPTKNKEIKNDNNNNKVNNFLNNNKRVLQNSIKEQIKKKSDYENIKNDFISTTINLFDKSQNKENKELFHSYSVENYGRIPNGSLPNFAMNLIRIEDSKIMDKNFIDKIRNVNRKDNLMKLLEQYKRFKSYNKINDNNFVNNSFTIGLNQDKNRQKSLEKIYTLNYSDKIIEEDENENSENDTIREKQNLRYKDKDKEEDKKYNTKNNKDNPKKNISEKEDKKEIIKSNKKEMINAGIFNKIQNVNRTKKLIIKNMIKYDNKLKDNIIKENRKIIKDKNNDKSKAAYNEYFNNYKSSNLNNNDIINSNNNNINKNMINNNNRNIHKNINNYTDKKKNQEVLVRKILREERYIIDENGKEKLLEINQSLLNENNNKTNIIKKPKLNDKNKAHYAINNNYIKINEKINKKERYHRNNKKFPEKRKIMINDIEENNLSNKIKKMNIINPPLNKSSINNRNQNSQNNEKERFHIDKVNRPVIIKKTGKVLQNNYSYNDIYRNQYKNININNNLNHVIYIQNQISPNKSPQKCKSNIRPEVAQGNQAKNQINKNHSYREINSMSGSKDITSKTIYHDYSNLDKNMKYNNSTVEINRQKIFNERKCGINKNYSLNIFHRFGDKTNNKGLAMENYNNNSYKYNKDYSKDNIINNNYKIFDNVNNNNYKHSRNAIKIGNKIIYYKQKNPPDSSKRYTNKSNIVIKKEKIYEQQNLINIYPHNNSSNKNQRRNPIKVDYVSNNYIFKTEDRQFN
mgnify:CR=1 FL=1